MAKESLRTLSLFPFLSVFLFCFLLMKSRMINLDMKFLLHWWSWRVNIEECRTSLLIMGHMVIGLQHELYCSCIFPSFKIFDGYTLGSAGCRFCKKKCWYIQASFSRKFSLHGFFIHKGKVNMFPYNFFIIDLTVKIYRSDLYIIFEILY